MARHDLRDHRGRFTASGAPIVGDDSTYEHVASPSADPLGEHDSRMITHYAPPVHDPANGAWQRRIPQRHAITIDAESGQAMAYAVDHEVRGVDAMMGGDLRAQAHLQAAQGDPFATNLMSHPEYDPRSRGHRHMGDPVDVPIEPATHTAWPGERGRPMRDR